MHFAAYNLSDQYARTVPDSATAYAAVTPADGPVRRQRLARSANATI